MSASGCDKILPNFFDSLSLPNRDRTICCSSHHHQHSRVLWSWKSFQGRQDSIRLQRSLRQTLQIYHRSSLYLHVTRVSSALRHRLTLHKDRLQPEYAERLYRLSAERKYPRARSLEVCSARNVRRRFRPLNTRQQSQHFLWSPLELLSSHVHGRMLPWRPIHQLEGVRLRDRLSSELTPLVAPFRSRVLALGT